MFFTLQEVVLALPPAAAEQPAQTVRVGFLHANAAPTITASDPLPGRVNHLRGDDPAQWHTDIPTYAGIVYQDLYAGIDLRYDGADGRLKGTYSVAPGAEPAQIRWRYGGVEQVGVDHASGDLRIIVAADQTLTEAAPVAWQDIEGQRVPVHARYHVAADGAIGFALGTYNAAHPLTIDPVLDYSTYLGGEGGDRALDVAVDGAGNTYVVGITNSPNFPTTTNAFDATLNNSFDTFVTKIGADGRTLLYATYLGGTRGDDGVSIAVDGQGQAYVTGTTLSTDFPTTVGAWDRTLSNGTSCGTPGPCDDVFVAKLSVGGNALVYATYLGGKAAEGGFGGPHVAVDTAGNTYVTARTSSSDFPTTPGAFDRTLALDPAYDPSLQIGDDVFVTKLNAQGTALVYSTLLGGTPLYDEGRDIAVDAHGHAHVLGQTFGDFPVKNAVQPTTGGEQDWFVTKLNAEGSDLLYSTYLGGNAYDHPRSIAIDAGGNTYVTGYTYSPNFPTKNALQPACKRCEFSQEPGYDAVVAKLNEQGTALVYSTYLGGTDADDAYGLAVDGAGNAYVAGTTISDDFPLKNAVQDTNQGSDAYVAKIDSAGTALIYATYLGGSLSERALAVAVSTAGTAYIVGETFSTDFQRPTRCKRATPA